MWAAQGGIWRHKIYFQFLRKRGAKPLSKQGFCRFPDRATTTLSSGLPGGTKPPHAEAVPSPQRVPGHRGHWRYLRVGVLMYPTRHELQYQGSGRGRNGISYTHRWTASASFQLTRRENTLSQPTGCKPSPAGCCEEVSV